MDENQESVAEFDELWRQTRQQRLFYEHFSLLDDIPGALSRYEAAYRALLKEDTWLRHSLEARVQPHMQAVRCMVAIRAEKAKSPELAILLYEQSIGQDFTGNHPYERLAILYRKAKRKDDEIRVLEKAVAVFRDIVSPQRGDRAIKLRRFEAALARAKGEAAPLPEKSASLSPEHPPGSADVPHVAPMRDVDRYLNNWRMNSFVKPHRNGMSGMAVQLLSTYYLPRPVDNQGSQWYYSHCIGESFANIITRWFEQGLLTNRLNPYDLIYYGLQLPELKNVLRSLGLKVSGKKDELAQRIIDAGHSATEPALRVCPEVLGCTQQGRAIVEEYLGLVW